MVMKAFTVGILIGCVWGVCAVIMIDRYAALSRPVVYTEPYRLPLQPF